MEILGYLMDREWNSLPKNWYIAFLYFLTKKKKKKEKKKLTYLTNNADTNNLLAIFHIL